MADDPKARFGGGTTPYEAHLERKRAALRNALKGEFLRQRHHPDAFKPEGGHVFDSAIQRYISMRATQGEYFYPTIKNFLRYCGLIVAPCAIFTYVVYYRKMAWERRCRQGLLEYDHPDRLRKWALAGGADY